jgi:hypothetical protein
MRLGAQNFGACWRHDHTFFHDDALLDRDSPFFHILDCRLAANRVTGEDWRAVLEMESHEAITYVKGAHDLFGEKRPQHLTVHHRRGETRALGMIPVVVESVPIPGGGSVRHHVRQGDPTDERREVIAHLHDALLAR